MDAMHHAAAMRKCIENGSRCHAICVETIRHGLERGGEHAGAAHLTLMQTCADICRTSADAMLRGDSAHVHTCRACAEIRRLCAEACEAMADDARMRECAGACRRCAESCARMAA